MAALGWARGHHYSLAPGAHPRRELTMMRRWRLCLAARAAWPQALTFFTGAGAPPPARTDADTSPRIPSSSARRATPTRLPRWGPRCGRRRFSLALGPHPQRELTLTPRLGFPRPRLGAPPQRGCRAGGPGVAAGAFHWRWGPTPSAN